MTLFTSRKHLVFSKQMIEASQQRKKAVISGLSQFQERLFGYKLLVAYALCRAYSIQG